MNRTPSLAFLLATALALGCATGPAREVGPLLGELRQNEVAAYAKYRGQQLRVTGVVLRTGLDTFSHLEGQQFGWTIDVREEQTTYPYVLLGDANYESPDVLKCYFSEDDVEEIGKVQPGGRIVLRGLFHQYVRDGEGGILLLGPCRFN